LIDRLFPILHVLGMIIGVFGLSMLLPLIISEWSDDAAQRAYDAAVLITLGCGVTLWLLGRHWKRELKARDGILLVVLTWLLTPLFAALPLMLFLPDLSFTDAYFETTSGLTTTGATVLSGLDGLPPSINIWRGQLHWLGGLGVIVLVVAVLPLLGVGGRQLYKAETPGPMKEDKLTPRMAETAKGLWKVYIQLTAILIGLYWLFGMTPADALVHAFSVMGLGGFSSHDASFGYFNSLPLELITVVFALIAGLNFAMHFHGAARPHTDAVSERPGNTLVFRLCAGQLPAARHPALGARHLSGFPECAARCHLQRHFNGHHAGFIHRRFRRLAVFRRAVAAVPVQFLDQRRLHRRRYQDVARLAALQTGVPRAAASDSPAWANQHPPGRAGGAGEGDLRGTGFFLRLCVIHRHAEFPALVYRAGCTHRVLRHRRLHQQHRPRAGPGRTFHDVCRADRFQTWICTFAMLLGRLELFTLLVVLTPAFWRK
jgi:trk system potassium uptake protein